MVVWRPADGTWYVRSRVGCQLDCSMGDCPDGMDCVGVGPGGAVMLCAWPPP